MNQKGIQEFIYFFLHNKSLSRDQIKLRDKLMERDIAAKMETTVDIGTSNNKGETDDLLIYKSPKHLQEFLLAYNQDPILKYTCHLIDSEDTIAEICKECATESYDFIKHSNLILRKFISLKSKFKDSNVSEKIIALITVYLTGSCGKETKWSSNSVEVNWKYNGLIEWSKQNAAKVPNPGRNIAIKQQNAGYRMESSFRSIYTGRRILTFGDLVIFFKSMFHIRRDNSLKTIIEYISKEKSGFEISFSKERFYDNLELFTDIDKLCQAYNNILKICKNNQPNQEEDTRIELSFHNNDNYTYFEIYHLNTVYGKSASNAIHRIGNDQMELIKNQINGLCDLFIEADFGNGDYERINLWDGNERRCKKIDSIKGVKYILRF